MPSFKAANERLAALLLCASERLIGLIEGIIYMTQPNQDFVDLNINGDKKWL